MPSVSESQKRLMAAAAHDPKFAEKAGIDMDVAKEFNQADEAEGDKKLPEKKKSTNESLIHRWRK